MYENKHVNTLLPFSTFEFKKCPMELFFITIEKILMTDYHNRFNILL